jgi:hypothetical protein
VCGISQAQFVNGGFESWTLNNVKNPTGYDNSGMQSVGLNGVSNVTQVAGHTGSYACKMLSITNPQMPFAYISNGIEDPTAGKGGVPYTQKPTTMYFWAQYDVKGLDSAIAVVMLKLGGAVVGVGSIAITGVSSGWQQISVPIVSPSPIIDSVIIAFSSSNAINGYGIADGSWLIVDDITFNTPNPVPLGDFEAWTDASIETPDGFLGWINLQAVAAGSLPIYEKTVDRTEGAYAMKFTVRQPNGFPDPIHIVSNGYKNGPSDQEGGVPFTQQSGVFSGYYKFSTGAADSARATVMFTKNGVTIGGCDTILIPTGTYTKFTSTFNLPQAPDSAFVNIIGSMKWPAIIGNVVYLDDLKFTSIPTAINLAQQDELSVKAVNGTIIVQSPSKGSYQLIDISGQLIATGLVNEGQTVISIPLRKGVYIIKVSNANAILGKKIFL